MSTRRAIVIVNPTAGGGRSATLGPPVQRLLQADGWETNTVLTESVEHAERIGRDSDPDTLLVAVGGDGLVARVAAGAVESGAVVAPVPGGRGNDLARYFGWTNRPSDAVDRIRRATVKQIDVGEANGRVFLGVAIVGFDSATNIKANQTSWLKGPPVYAYAAFQTICDYTPTSITVEVDGVTSKVQAWSIGVGNSGRQGGGMQTCPNASVEDGVLDMVTVKAMPKSKYLRTMLGVFNGTHVPHPKIDETTCRTIRITADDDATPIPVFADGDPLTNLPVDIVVRPNALRIVV